MARKRAENAPWTRQRTRRCTVEATAASIISVPLPVATTTGRAVRNTRGSAAATAA